MKRTSRISLGPFVIAGALAWGLVIPTLTATAQGTVSQIMFQRSVDSPSPGANGIVLLKKQGAKQIFSVTVNNLPGSSFGVFYGVANNTNSPVFLISVMNRQGANNDWVLHYEAVGGAPPQLPVPDLDDLAGLYLFIAQPSGTNAIVNGVLFTQIPPLTKRSAAPHFNTRSRLALPAGAPPNPAEKGTIQSAFIGTRGRSLFSVRATNLSGGGSYTLLLEDPPSSSSFTNIGSLVLSTDTTTGTFARDTANGETLPFELPTSQDLSGRGIQIRDAFNQLHLEGVVP